MQDLAARVAEHGVSVVDAPVSGGDAAALSGSLLVITGGDDELCTVCAPMFATYAGRIVHTGPLGSAKAAKLINNSVMTAITGLVFDAFDLGAALDVDRDRLGEVLANGSAANPSVGIYLGLGADRFSAAAWPTLHKDVALAHALGIDTKILLDAAASTIAEMDGAGTAHRQRTNEHRAAQRRPGQRRPGRDRAAARARRDRDRPAGLAAFGSCFTDDAIGDYGDIGTFVGAAALTDFMIAAHGGFGSTNHMVSNFVVLVDGDRATGGVRTFTSSWP